MDRFEILRKLAAEEQDEQENDVLRKLLGRELFEAAVREANRLRITEEKYPGIGDRREGIIKCSEEVVNDLLESRFPGLAEGKNPVSPKDLWDIIEGYSYFPQLLLDAFYALEGKALQEWMDQGMVQRLNLPVKTDPCP